MNWSFRCWPADHSSYLYGSIEGVLFIKYHPADFVSPFRFLFSFLWTISRVTDARQPDQHQANKGAVILLRIALPTWGLFTVKEWNSFLPISKPTYYHVGSEVLTAVVPPCCQFLVFWNAAAEPALSLLLVTPWILSWKLRSFQIKYIFYPVLAQSLKWG